MVVRLFSKTHQGTMKLDFSSLPWMVTGDDALPLAQSPQVLLPPREVLSPQSMVALTQLEVFNVINCVLIIIF